MIKIPVCEPYLAGNELKYVNDAVITGWISSSGSYVKKFEKEFAAYCNVNYGISVSNGTVALHIALKALGIGAGDEVIIPSFTMVATAFAVCYTGAIPVFVDSDPDTWNIDVSAIEEKITSKTKAIIPVHIFGNPCNMDEINNIAQKYNLYIIEDAAEAHGAEYHGKKVGSFSQIACFSFFANKNITTGEGGMCITDNEKYMEYCNYFKNMCFPINGQRNYLHDDIGFNYRMSNIHAAIGLAQVEKADFYRDLRIKNNLLYRKFLQDCPGIRFQKNEDDVLNVCWMNAIVVEPDIYGHTKDELIQKLQNYNIETRVLFKSMSRQKSLNKYGCNCSQKYPVTDWLSDNGLYLPSASNLEEIQIFDICEIIRNFGRK